MKFNYTILAFFLLTLLFNGCSARKSLIGKWKVVEMHLSKNNILETNSAMVFDPEGFITFNNGSAARGEWEMNTSKSILTIFLYGKALQHDLQIKGEYDFAGDKLTITSLEDESKVLLALTKIEEAPVIKPTAAE